MARILVVGNATLDILQQVAHYPAEDAEVRASAQWRRRGGNAANTAVVLAQHGHEISFVGSLAADSEAQAIRADLTHYGIALNHCQIHANGNTPLSCITLSQQTGSRTIVHYRDLPELDATAFAKIALAEFDWFHFEGRNPEGLLRMLDTLDEIRLDQPVSIEMEKPRHGIDALLPRADVLLFSRSFAKARGCEAAERLFDQISAQVRDAILVCAWAEQGAFARQRDNELHVPAQRLATICDSTGAGDTFNAGVIHGLLSGQPLMQALEYANWLAAKKLRQAGFAKLIEHA